MSVRVIGCDFGVPKKAGDQANKIILIEAVKVGKLQYSIQPTGRNARLLHKYSKDATWKENRRGWTLPDLAQSLSTDTSIKVAAFDFPFSLPLALLNDVDFASQMGQAPFRTRAAWAKFVSNRLRLAFDNETRNGEMQDLSQFEPWRDKKYWIRRATDSVTNGSPPLKHKFQNVFAMTLAGTALLSLLESHGYKTLFDSALPIQTSCIIETYPRAVANQVGFTGSYKANPDECLRSATEFLLKQGIKLDFDSGVRRFCETYRSSANDPDGADAFLCLVTAITCLERMAEICGGQASRSVLTEEGVIVVPTPHRF